MDNVRTFALSDNFIARTADFIIDNFGPSMDLSRIACIYTNKRPSLFLNRELAYKIKNNFFPPKAFVMDEFVEHLLLKREKFSRISSTEAAYIIYRLIEDIDPSLLKGRASFSSFFPWAREIYSFIQHLDLEDIKPEALSAVEKSAAIGYEIPETINSLLLNINKVRDLLHKKMEETKSYSRGYQYLKAQKMIAEEDLPEYEKILFCNFFYLQRTEKQIIKRLHEKDKAVLLFQGEEASWPVLKENARYFNVSISAGHKDAKDPGLNIYSAHDSHSEAAVAGQILGGIKKQDSAVVVLPDASSSLPLLSEISSSVKDFNVSVGYPLKRSSLYVLLKMIFEAQLTAKNNKYYSKHYLAVMMHPLAKNIKLLSKREHSRILVHKIEESLKGFERSKVSGSLFIDLKEVLNDNKILSLVNGMIDDPDIKIEDLRSALKELHEILFKKWEKILTPSQFAACLHEFTEIMGRSSILGCYPLNYSVAQKLFDCADMLKNCSFAEEHFEKSEIFKIFEDIMGSKKVDFSGTPLKGLQVLGLYKTHCLNFDEVIVLDVNEGVLPSTGLSQPLIPREVMLGLGLSRILREEEIERYQFMRLISSAENVHLIYKNDDKSTRSRFIEELIWQREKKERKLDIIKVKKVIIPSSYSSSKQEAGKTPEILKRLKGQVFSHSSVNTYMDCPKQFYFRYVLGLREKESLLSDIEASDIGNFIHELLESAYKDVKGSKPDINADFRKKLFTLFNKEFEAFFSKRMASDSFLLKELVKNKLDSFLAFEKDRNIRKIICLEEKVDGLIGDFNFTAKIDRIDELEDGTILVIDYKTGDIEKLPSKNDGSLLNLSDRKTIKKIIKSFQLPIYLHLAEKELKFSKMNAALYGIKTTEIKPLWKDEAEDRKQHLLTVYIGLLKKILNEIIDPDVNFMADDEDEKQCDRCPYFYMCR
ncbi:MAG: PD-(D/E)XK nuclease family protein [Candidatus Saganbacteria bacterium]|nr:PD-(D/E)XK nuclease family protein [Candidatus Saganbacteria bacterium]